MWLDKLRSMKDASGKTTKQICEESGVALGTLNKLFAGQTSGPKLDTIKAVVYSLGGKLSDLDDIPPETEKSPSITDEDERVLGMYHQLDAVDQGFILGEMRVLLLAEKYQQEKKRPAQGNPRLGKKVFLI